MVLDMVLDIDGQRAFIATSETPVNNYLPRLIFVHGAQNDHRVWEAQQYWFSQRGYGTFAPDFPGHGASAGAPLVSIELMAQWLGKLLLAISPVGAGVESRLCTDYPLRRREAVLRETPASPASYVLIGHSMGSLAALACVADHSSHIAALVLIGTAFPMKVSPALLEQTRTDEAAAIAQIAQWSHAPNLPDANSDAINARSERLATAQQLMCSQIPGVLHNDLSACNSYILGLEAAAKITCPCLVVCGSKDQMTAPKYAVKLQETLRAESATLDGAGHAMMSEQNDALCEAIHQFLSAHFNATVESRTGKSDT